jgi:dipeptidyl aminopeptidase/acylaminoacyl peptidase
VIALDASSGRATALAADAPAWEDRLVSVPVPLWIPREDGTRTHAFLHQPSRVPAGSSRTGPPPLILNLHGGPTDSAPLSLQPELLLWTSRGFAVLDLNYSGSSGFGRAYRERLYEAWGDADLADCLAAVRWLVADGVVDGRRVFVRGGSAGGYLTLQCLTHSTAFRGGMCRCGIADLAMWRNDAHDFESRYTDLLVGPPSESARYAERSPARHVRTQAAPVLIVHGQADAVVPPGHARAIADSYRRAGRPHRVVLLDGEPHGFRRADSRARWLGVELDFAASLLATAP